MNRRKFIFSTILTSFFFGFKTHSKELIPIHVYKDPNCGCCKKWINILNKKGFKATSEDMYSSELVQFKIKNKIPVSYTHLRAHETLRYLVCRLLLEK